MPNRRAFGVKLFAVAILFAILAASALKVPLYSDELVYHQLLGNYLSNLGEVANYYPQCNPANWHPKVPAIFAPALVFGNMLYGLLPNPNWLRITGILLLFANATLFFRNTRKVIGSRDEALALTLGFFTLGILPMNWSIHRPDGWLFLSLQILAAILFRDEDRKTSPAKELLSLGVVVFICVVLCAIHSNALYLAPLLALAAITTRNSPILIGTALLVMTAAQKTAYDLALIQTSCSFDPILDEVYRKFILTPADLIRAPADFLSKFAINTSGAWKYVYDILFHQRYEFGWFPNWLDVPPTYRLLNASVVFCWALAAASLIPKKPAEGFRSLPRIGREAWAAPILLATAFGIAGLQTKKNFYTSQLVLPLLIYSLLSLRRTIGTDLLPSARALLGKLILPVSALNAVFVGGLFMGPEVNELKALPYARTGGLSLVINRPAEFAAALQDLQSGCGLPANKALKHVLIDDLTYWQFRDSYHPIHATYLARSQYTRRVPSIIDFLRERGSSGIFVQCQTLSDMNIPIGASTAISQGICCIRLESARGDANVAGQADERGAPVGAAGAPSRSRPVPPIK